MSSGLAAMISSTYWQGGSVKFLQKSSCVFSTYSQALNWARLLNVGKSGVEVLELSIDLLNSLLSLGNLLNEREEKRFSKGEQTGIPRRRSGVFGVSIMKDVDNVNPYRQYWAIRTEQHHQNAPIYATWALYTLFESVVGMVVTCRWILSKWGQKSRVLTWCYLQP